jgi:hypothetical protein
MARVERPNHQSLSSVLEQCAGMVGQERFTIADVARLLGDRSLEAILLVLALPMVIPVPAPGISVVFGLPLTILSVQLAFGRRQIWLPAVLAKGSVSQLAFVRMIEGSLPTLQRMERFVKPRLGWLTGSWTRFPIGLICAVLALIIVLPVPLGHFVPGMAISLLALGLLERDGLIVGLGLGIALFGFALVTLASLGTTHLITLLRE